MSRSAPHCRYHECGIEPADRGAYSTTQMRRFWLPLLVCLAAAAAGYATARVLAEDTTVIVAPADQAVARV